MLVSTKGRYAMRMMLYFGRNYQGKPISLAEVGKEEEISAKYLEQLARALVRAGILKGLRGQKGGYYLAKPVSEITPGDILRAVESKQAPVGCTALLSKGCPRKDGCGMIHFWSGLQDIIDEYVDSVTLEQLCK